MARKFAAPFAQRRLLDVQPPALLTDRLDDGVHVRMPVIGVQGQRVAMFEGEFLATELLAAARKPSNLDGFKTVGTKAAGDCMARLPTTSSGST